jgi:hypothetical protein
MLREFTLDFLEWNKMWFTLQYDRQQDENSVRFQRNAILQHFSGNTSMQLITQQQDESLFKAQLSQDFHITPKSQLIQL